MLQPLLLELDVRLVTISTFKLGLVPIVHVPTWVLLLFLIIFSLKVASHSVLCILGHVRGVWEIMCGVMLCNA